LRSVSAEEKREFQRYLVGIGVKDGKLNSIGSLLNDQNLREYLSELTFPVYNVKDFDSLSIPTSYLQANALRKDRFGRRWRIE
jgi:NTE family protein